jgi:hypothetical protein
MQKIHPGFELFPVYWILQFQMDFVSKVLGQAQVKSVYAQSVLVLVKNVHVFFFAFLRDL